VSPPTVERKYENSRSFLELLYAKSAESGDPARIRTYRGHRSHVQANAFRERITRVRVMGSSVTTGDVSPSPPREPPMIITPGSTCSSCCGLRHPCATLRGSWSSR
jgi:hypothetical protein